MSGAGEQESRGERGQNPPHAGGQKEGKPSSIAGGYRLIPVREIAAVWFLQMTGRLRIADIRAYLACHEATARRCALPPGKPAKFTLAEIRALTGGEERRVAASLARLEAAGVLTFTESAITFAKDLPPAVLPPAEFTAYLDRFPNNRRLLPVPRRILRLMAGGARRSLLATLLGHMLWGLYRAPARETGQGGFNATGRVKCSWIADTFGIDLRRVKEARAELISLGWLIPEESRQWELNRYGARFSIDIDWQRSREGSGTSSEQKRPAELAPPPAASATALPPPESDKKLPAGSYKNQKPAFGGPAGAKSLEQKAQRPENPAAKEAKPNLRDMVPTDLKEPKRLFELHGQAVEAGFISPSESERLKFFAAAEHARVIGTSNPCGLFSRLVRSKLWHYLTQDDEDAANRRLKGLLFGGAGGLASTLPSMPGMAGQAVQRTARPVLSDDAKFVRDVSNMLRGKGIPESSVWRLVNRERPEWSRERWDRAYEELKGTRAL